jgi:NifU-like protein involved in Fe-S cluster formation
MKRSETRLYTPEMLHLAMRLGDYPWNDELPLRGEARSLSCGSRLKLGLSCLPNGQIDQLGVRIQACAVGQAACSIFAISARSRDCGDVAAALRDISDWLDGSAALPPWPGLDVLSAVIEFPGRHGAITLPWRAAVEALCSDSTAR